MLRFDEAKALQTILYLAEKRGRIDLYALVKIVYFADKEHLKRWGRTITGDQHVRMNHGPTPSAVYDMLKSVRGDQDWPTDLNQSFKFEGCNDVIPLAPPDLDEFSESDLECLDWAFDKYRDKSFGELKEAAHDSAYKRSLRFYMTDEDLAEGDPDLIDHIRHEEEMTRYFEDSGYGEVPL
jgi:hypothetical protein